MVQESLRNVANEFGKNGAVNSELPGLLAKTEEKLTELDNEINNIQNELNSLENELRASDV